MNPIQFECPYCHEVITGEDSQYGQRVTCGKCHATIVVPLAPTGPEPLTARLIPNQVGRVPFAPDAAGEESDIFNLSPVARAFSGQILLGLIFLGLGIGLEIYAQDYTWAPPAALATLALGVLVLLLVWIRMKSCHYRLTSQRLFVRRGWLAKHVDELELYRVKDVVVDQGILQRMLGFGTILVLADDDTTPRLALVDIPSPTKFKEMIRTQYRAARQREGVRPTEFMHSP